MLGEYKMPLAEKCVRYRYMVKNRVERVGCNCSSTRRNEVTDIVLGCTQFVTNKLN